MGFIEDLPPYLNFKVNSYFNTSLKLAFPTLPIPLPITLVNVG